ncbi:molybdopterin-dependent oxidoreductase [Scleromatobacter humisilvae]|uniref:Molybdopterin-dependent oxidoreductase n=1 Tax=Scleromatobacter humisilvae TaxID=2897159 RepID=A0A9X1YN49_9BURK|nr:molybdopterin-dependent oxidoreductase [Scleromatobacter humisilvae]MCK9688530.1 molybdopterin-dependent oxidoreductase [Scleromatobacter humisilvae]
MTLATSSTGAASEHAGSASPTRVVQRICPLCEACCGLSLTVSGTGAHARVIAIRGDEQDVFSHGYVCPKAVALKDLEDDPDRLRHPLIKRDGRFVEASWNEAHAEIARRLPPLLAVHGRDALAFTLGNPNVHRLGLGLYVQRLLRAAGSRNVFSASTLDQMPRQLASGWMYGHPLTVPVPDIDHCDFLLMLGANPMASNGSMWTVPDFRGRAKAMRARGGHLVVIDPRRTETAAIADEHHFIRPGTDVFLLLGMLHAVFDQALAQPGRLGEFLSVGDSGIEALQAAVATYTPARMAARCGVPAETQRALVRRLAASPRAAVYSRIGSSTQRFGTLNSVLIDALNILTGHLDREGGVMFPNAAAFAANTQGKPGVGRGMATGRTRSRVSGAPEVLGEYPTSCLAEEIETGGPGQIKALISVASNPVLSAPNGARIAQALRRLDFMVSVDIYLNETTQHADVILPGLSSFEEPHYDVSFPQLSCRNHARYSPPVLPARPDAQSEWQSLLRIAALLRGEPGADLPDFDLAAFDDRLLADDLRRQAAGVPDELQAAMLKALGSAPGPERLLDLALRAGPHGDRFGQKPGGLSLDALKAAPHGVDLGALQPRLPEILRTPSGRIELWPMPVAAELAAVDAVLLEPPPDLVVVGRRDVRSNNSWMHNLPTLAKGPERCTALLNPADAARHGVQAGDRVRLHGTAGRAIELPVTLSDEMMPGVVSVPHGWGHDQAGARLGVAAQRPGANLNDLLDDQLRDPLSGTSVLNGVPVTLSRCV